MYVASLDSNKVIDTVVKCISCAIVARDLGIAQEAYLSIITRHDLLEMYVMLKYTHSWFCSFFCLDFTRKDRFLMRGHSRFYFVVRQKFHLCFEYSCSFGSICIGGIRCRIYK